MKIIRPMTPLRRRMREDMQIRNYSPHTIDGYLRYVAHFAKHLGTSPDRLGPAHIRTYQLHLLHQQASKSIFIQTVCALRFLYETTLGRPWMAEYIPYPKKPKTLPVILSRDEVKALLLAPRHLKHRAILATLYATAAGEVARYIGRHGTQRVAKAVLIGAIPPLMLQTPANPGGLPMETFDQLRSAVLADRSQFWKDLSMPFYGYNRPGATISEGVRESFWLQGMMCGFPGAYFCIKAFSETDLTEDLTKMDIPTLFLHGDDDQIVPIADSAMLAVKLVKRGTLKVYQGAPHGMCTTLKDQVNADLLDFFKA